MRPDATDIRHLAELLQVVEDASLENGLQVVSNRVEAGGTRGLVQINLQLEWIS